MSNADDNAIITFLTWALQLEPDPDRLCKRCGLPRWQCRCRSLRLHNRTWLAEHYGLDWQDTNPVDDDYDDEYQLHSAKRMHSSLTRCIA